MLPNRKKSQPKEFFKNKSSRYLKVETPKHFRSTSNLLLKEMLTKNRETSKKSELDY